jgi:hypothetical protein
MSAEARFEAGAAARSPGARDDDVLTVIAIAVLAFMVADVAHEVIGHGVAYAALGGRSCVLTTTRLIRMGRLGAEAAGSLGAETTGVLGDLGGRVFSIGGPLGNLAFAGLAWWGQRRRRALGVRTRGFLWLVMAFNLFWATGYLIWSGVTQAGDWAELVRGLAPAWLWRPGLVVLGAALYGLAMRLVAAEMHRFVDVREEGWRRRAWRLVRVSYLAAGVVACAGAWFDPRGAEQVLASAVPETFVGMLGLLAAPGRWPRASDGLQDDPAAAPGSVTRSLGWILAAVAAAAIFIGVLGPGVRI